MSDSAASTTPPRLETVGLSCRFGGVRALSEVSVRVTDGQIAVLLGPNGAGKSVFVDVVCGELRASAGRVLIGGCDLTHSPGWRLVCHGVARTFQIPRPLRSCTVWENVHGAAGRVRKPGSPHPASARPRAEQALARVGLLHRRDSLPDCLSLAELRKLELARALALAPRLLLLDEPMAGLSAEEIDDTVGLLTELRAQGIAILAVEHVMRAVLAMADSVYFLHQGSVLRSGPPVEVLADRRVVAMYLGVPVGAIAG